jgi:predicted AAA+ superfamily ATPase
MEDNRLEGFTVADFNRVESIAKNNNKELIILDEVQNIREWEKYVRSAHERGIHLQITGSNASMLSRELGTKLTGRYHQIELFPFSFAEFLLYSGETPGHESLMNYLENGGFPEYLAEKEPDYLRTLLRDIVMRDIAVRRDIKNEHYLLRLAVNLLSNIGKEFSYNNLTKTLEIKSVRTTIDFCEYLKESYLIDLLPKFSYSIHKQQANPKKAYCIDTAMAAANSLSFSQNTDRLLENAVFLALRRKFQEIYYFNDGRHECDFLIKEKEEIILAVQVCAKLTPDNLTREVLGLKAAMQETKCSNGIILTIDQKDETENIPIVPAWEWMLMDGLA